MTHAASGDGTHLGDERLTELLLTPDSDARDAPDRAHLAGCPDCQQRSAVLAELGERLRALPRLTMPAQVTADLDAALAAAERELAFEPERVPAAEAEAGTGAGRGWREHRPRARTLLGVAAALVIVAGLFGLAHRVRQGSSASTATAAAPSGGAAGSAEAGAVPAATAPDAAGTGGPLPSPISTAGAQLTDSGVDYHHATLTQGVSTLLSEAANTKPGAAEGTLRLPTGCLAALIEQAKLPSGAVPVLVGVDVDRYDEQPALLIVLSGVPAPGSSTGYAVSTACTTGAAHLLDHVVVTS